MSGTTGLRARTAALLLLMSAGPIAAAQGDGSVAAAMERAQQAFTAADIVGAMAAYREAAELGHAPAQTRLAHLLDNAERNEEAAAWYARAAAQGEPEAQFGLGALYSIGEGVEADMDQAVQWIRRAAEQGYPEAIRVLATAYERGELGLEVSYDQASRWLRAGVDAGDGWAAKRLARAYRRGELGLRMDPAQADALERGAARDATQ